MRINSLSDRIFYKGIYPQKDYEKKDFLNNIKQETEADIFEHSVKNAPQYYHYVGKIFENAGKYDIALNFYKKNYTESFIAQDPKKLDIADKDLKRIKEKINGGNYNEN